MLITDSDVDSPKALSEANFLGRLLREAEQHGFEVIPLVPTTGERFHGFVSLKAIPKAVDSKKSETIVKEKVPSFSFAVPKFDDADADDQSESVNLFESGASNSFEAAEAVIEPTTQSDDHSSIDAPLCILTIKYVSFR